jgi:hypothetical protein
MKFAGISVALAAVTVLASTASAATRITMATTDSARGGAPMTSTMTTDGRNVKLEASAAPGYVIYRGDRKVMYHVNTGGSSYTEVTKESMQAMGSQIGAAMGDAQKRMQESFAKMTPEQRAMAEQFMKQSMPQAVAPSTPAAAPAVRVVATGKTGTFGGYACTGYDVFRGEEKVAEVWAAPWDKVKVPKNSLDALKDMTAFLEESTKGFGGGKSKMGTPLAAYDQIDGFPVCTRQYMDGAVRSETVFSSSETVPDRPADYEVPAGFRKTDMMGGMGGR